jgi:hypothetical protein
MNLRPFKTSLLAASLVLGLGGAAFAQTTTTGTTAAPATNANTAGAAPRNDDRGFDWGWLGLIGLAGLAGLNRRDRPRAVETQSSVR